MDFQVSARKWRPQKFGELIGQEPIVRTLVNAIKLGRISHAYLFSGTRGVGKTTTARIFAKALNCERGPNPEPCDQCDFCKEIKLGSCIDVREIDGASNNSVAEARELVENIQYVASASRYKVYIIDEVHMLSKSAFNALLKTLEEPPPKVVFLFATTEISKIPETILSRCQCFEFKPLSHKQIIKQLELICGQEDIQSDELSLEEIAKADASASVIMSVNNSLVCAILDKHGSDFQKKKYLSKLTTGEILGAFSLSEPQSGSDASNMLTFAVKKDNEYILNGTKNWVTNGINSDLVIVFALTEKNVGHKGISCFIVEKSVSGFEVGKPEDKLGIRASDTSELYFDNVRIPKENLSGEEGGGFKIALSTLDGGRIGIASQALGIAQASLDASIQYSKERKQFNKSIASFQGIQFKIADMSIEIDAARLLIRKAAWYKDNKMDYGVMASKAKVFASEVAMRASTECVQIHGGYGYIQETGVERLMRDAKITQIYEGTSEIQRVVIARNLLK